MVRISLKLIFSRLSPRSFPKDLDGTGIKIAVGALKILVSGYDLITLPGYIIAQRPWKIRALANRIRAKPIQKDANSITYRSTSGLGPGHALLRREKIDTMVKVLEYVSQKFAHKKCLGTRQILGEVDEAQPDGTVLKKLQLGEYRWKTFSEVNAMAENFGKGVRELDNKPGENIAIFAETCAEWMIAAHGLFKQNIPLVTIYANLGEESIAISLNETEVTTVITSFELMPKLKDILFLTPKVKTLIYIDNKLTALHDDELKDYQAKTIKFTEVLKKGAESKIAAVPPTTNDTAIIMYTSGSTDKPKGVILLHKNLITTLMAFADLAIIKENDVMIGFLPLAHIFELLIESTCLLVGVPIGYSAAATLTDTAIKIGKGYRGDATVLRPSLMTSVPLILDRISKFVFLKASRSSTMRRIVFHFAYDYKVAWTNRGCATPLVDKVVFGPVRKVLGGRVRVVITGGAPLSAETHERMAIVLCATIIQGYGLTESTSLATAQDFYDQSYGRVGATTTGCDIQLINWNEHNYKVTDKPYPRGEVIVGGDNISAGYYKMPEKTAEDYFEAGGKRWFKTGDIAEVHDDGVVKIIDRKKDLVKLQAGEYVSLGKVEAHMKTCRLVDDMCVYAESTRQFCVALVVPNRQQLQELALEKGLGVMVFEDMCRSPEVVKAVLEELTVHGKKTHLHRFEIPRVVTLVTEVWTPDTGLVTAALKLKRLPIQERYEKEIARMYAS